MKMFLAFLFILSITSTVFSELVEKEREALLAIHESTDGPNWGPYTWDTTNDTSDPCLDNWAGVQCNFGGQHVQTISLQANNLKGTLPEQLGDLTYLNFLYFSKNALSGTIPSSIGNLKLLIQLGLDLNQLEGTIPETMSQLKELQHLFLQDNQLTGTLDPIVGMVDLQIFYVSRNQLSGTIPFGIGNLKQLQQFGIDSNNVEGSLPSSLVANQPNLVSFYAQLNKLNGTVSPSQWNPVATCDMHGNNFQSCPVPPVCNVCPSKIKM